MGSEVEANGTRLWVEQRGAGHDVVLLSGVGDSHLAWSRQVDTFSRDFHVTAIDNRGVGQSALPDGPFTVRDMADDAAAVLEALDVGPAHLIGFSMGGAIAQELAIVRPDLVGSLVLVGTWARTDAYQHELFESWKRLANDATSEEGFARTLALWVYTRRAHADGSIERWIAQMVDAPHPQSTDAWIRSLDAIQAHDTADRLGRISAPTLVIGGDSDLICPAEVQTDLAARIPGARLELLAGEAHQPFQEAPDEFDRIVLGFLETA
jgi:pimeloyl-ACP methyl ester carboxylesterase